MKHYKGDLTDFIIETVDKNNINAAMIKKCFFISDTYNKHASDLFEQVSCKGYNQKRQRKAITYLIDSRRENISSIC